MSVSKRGQKATARTMQPVTTFLRNQRFAASAQRQQAQSSTTGKRKRVQQNAEMSSHGSGPDYRLKLYEEAIQTEYLAKGLKPLPKAALRRAAERRRDDRVLQDMQAIGKRVHERAGQAMFEAAMQNDDPMLPDTYIHPEENEDDWITEHACFIDADSEYSKSQRIRWNKVKEEEAALAAALFEFEGKHQGLESEGWAEGGHPLTLVAAGPRLQHRQVTFSLICPDHGVIDEHANRLELVARGYIPVSMGKQNVAIAADVLSLYMKVLVYGPLSRQGWVRAMCDHVKVEYTDHARVMFGDALELYTRLLDINDQKLENESDAGVGAMFTLDGNVKSQVTFPKLPHTRSFRYEYRNFSWKRLGRHKEANHRIYDDSDFRIPPKEVDRHQPANTRGRTAGGGEDSEDHFMERCSETRREITQTVMKHNDETGIVTLVKGLEDFEGCERLFSYTNKFAGMARHANRDTRRWILRHVFRHWNWQKYRNQVNVHLLPSLDDNDLEVYQQQEVEFLRKTDSVEQQAERRRVEAKIAYIREREGLSQLQAKLDDVYEMLAARTPTDHGRCPPMTGAQTRILGDAQHKVAQQQKKVAVLAVSADISDDDEWTPESDCWKITLQEEKKLKYRTALRDVEVECIQRLFEMEKMGFAGTAYRHRKKIMTAVKGRNQRLKDLITKCNEAGKAAGYTEELEWQHVVEDKIEIGLFAVLQQMREGDLLIHKWAQPVSREALRLWFQINRSEEELKRLAIEWRRLRAWVDDREAHLRYTIAQLRQTSTDQRSDHAHQLGVTAGLERRLQQMQRDHRKILFSLDRCADALIDSDCADFTMLNPIRSTHLRHLPEMNRYNLRAKHNIGQDFSIPPASKQSNSTYGHGSESIASEAVSASEEPLLEERNESLLEFLA
ncbi:hypothetical protein QFC24_000700 [Naganishia onofrii]|uniref:Uncharacterized protein n=1 Tax=Naganishia onofrii TaxID=1851511 RepID=A0ACC2XUI7_9TREE|nr:hypothetical protein QFC24_000700 [Naganishia onofrii]